MGSAIQLRCKTVVLIFECLYITWSNKAVVFPLPAQTLAYIYTPENTLIYKSKVERLFGLLHYFQEENLYLRLSGCHSHSSWVPARWPTFGASTDLSTELPGMRSWTCVLEPCNSQHSSKHLPRLWVTPAFASFSVKEPTTPVHPVSPSVSRTTLTVLSPTLLPTLQPVAPGQHHPSTLYPAAYIFHPLAPDEKCKVPCSFSQPNLLRSFCPERQ